MERGKSQHPNYMRIIRIYDDAFAVNSRPPLTRMVLALASCLCGTASAVPLEPGDTLDAFSQVAPRTGEPPTRRTELRITQDAHTLFIEVRAWDPEPAGIVAQQMRRDAEGLLGDDHVAVVIDVDGQGRNGYLFAVNPNGAQYDSLIFDGGQERRDWDALWRSEASVDGQGWSARMSIPLSALGLRADADEPLWRINAERWMPRGSERVRLAGASPDREVFALGEALPMRGVRPDRTGWGVRLKSSLRAVSESAAASGTGRSRRQLEPGLELFHQSAGGLRTTAALNIDFGDAEADERVVNLSRFELFRPEKREFFLQDAGRFSFGGLSMMSPIPYYSRRVGLDAQGRGRSLDAGLKFSGSVGELDFGLFGARVAGGPVAPGLPDQRSADVSVARVSRSFGESHRAGLIATAGNPQGSSGSHLWGLDYQFRDSRWQGERTLETHVWMQESTNPGLGSDQATGFSLNYPNLGPKAYVSVQRIGERFEPALGFLDEAGVTRSEGSVGWWHRTEGGQDIVPGIDWNLRRRLDGSERSWLLNPEVELVNAAGDFLLPEIFFEGDRVATAFSPVPGLTVAPGSYRWHYLYLLSETSQSRPVSAVAEWRSGGYYTGRRNDQGLTLRWHPSSRWSAAVGGMRNAIRFDEGRFTVRMATLRIDHTPSTRLASSLLLQWDNVSHELGASGRLRWQCEPGRELIFSIDRLGYTGEQRDTLPGQTRALLKLVWTLER